MLENLKRPEDLQDRDILMALDRSRGAGVQFGEFICQRTGETPINFIAKVKGAYSAWYNRKEAESRREAADRARDSVRESPRPEASRVTGIPTQNVQVGEVSLEKTLQSQVDALTQEYARAERAYADAKLAVESAKRRWYYVDYQLRNAKRFIKELKEEDGNREYTPDTYTPVGSDLPEEVGQGEQAGSNRVGESVDSPGPRISSTEADQDTPSGASE